MTTTSTYYDAATAESLALQRVRAARRDLRNAEQQWRANCAQTADVAVALLAARAAQAKRRRLGLFARVAALLR